MFGQRLFSFQSDEESQPGLGRSGMHPQRRMREAIVLERARVDRYGGQFSVVSFKPCETGGGSLGGTVMRAILRRVRETDQAGWIERRSVGVLLPCTDETGAKSFAESVCNLVEEKHPRLVYAIDTYPGDDADHGNGFSDRLQLDRPASAPQRGLRLAGVGQVAARSLQTSDSARRVEADRERISMLVVHPMPIWKRAMDIAGALIGLLLFLPVMMVAAAVMKMTSPGPVLFKQLRSGLGGRPFVIYKLRTMVADAEDRKDALMELNEQDGPAFKISNDPRITTIGRFFRNTSIDELPQLWNVLKGEMSLVGPRPLPVEEAELCSRWQLRRQDVTPGMTCIWQANGRPRNSFANWVRMDIEYLRRRSFLCDLQILLQTIPAVIQHRGTEA